MKFIKFPTTPHMLKPAGGILRGDKLVDDATRQQLLLHPVTVEEKVDGAASLCIQCGECLEKCPQHIDIPDMIKKAVEIFEEGKKISEVFS